MKARLYSYTEKVDHNGVDPTHLTEPKAVRLMEESQAEDCKVVCCMMDKCFIFVRQSDCY